MIVVSIRVDNEIDWFRINRKMGIVKLYYKKNKYEWMFNYGK